MNVAFIISISYLSCFGDDAPFGIEQLLVNRTLYEKSLASGFGTVHFIVDASEEQQVSVRGGHQRGM